MEKFKINKGWMLINLVSSKFEDGVGDIKPEFKDKIESINYFADSVEIIFKDGQSLSFYAKLK